MIGYGMPAANESPFGATRRRQTDIKVTSTRLRLSASHTSHLTPLDFKADDWIQSVRR
jgi:hypothetical protein